MPYTNDGTPVPYDRDDVYDQDADRPVDLTDPDRDLPVDPDRDVYTELAWARSLWDTK
jgi:hypothetical protein